MTRLVLFNNKSNNYQSLLLWFVIYIFLFAVVIETTTSFQYQPQPQPIPRLGLCRQRFQQPTRFYNTKKDKICDLDDTVTSISTSRVSIAATDPRAHKDHKRQLHITRSQFLVSSLIGASSLLLMDVTGDRWSISSSSYVANAIDLDSLSKDAKKLQKDVEKESKKIQKTVNKEVKKAQKETKKVTKKIEKEVKKDIKVVNKEIKKVDKVVQKETKKMMKQVDQSTHQIKSKIESKTGGGGNASGRAASGTSSSKVPPPPPPSSTTTGIDVSKIKKVCNDPVGKCL